MTKVFFGSVQLFRDGDVKFPGKKALCNGTYSVSLYTSHMGVMDDD